MNTILKYFEYSHLPEHLQLVSKPIGELATQMDELLPDGAEKTAAFRDLLKAKDAFVRAGLELDLIVQEPDENDPNNF